MVAIGGYQDDRSMGDAGKVVVAKFSVREFDVGDKKGYRIPFYE